LSNNQVNISDIDKFTIYCCMSSCFTIPGAIIAFLLVYTAIGVVLAIVGVLGIIIPISIGISGRNAAKIRREALKEKLGRKEGSRSNIPKIDPNLKSIGMKKLASYDKDQPKIDKVTYQSMFQEMVKLAVNTNSKLTIVQKVEKLLRMKMMPAHIPLLLGWEPEKFVEKLEKDKKIIYDAIQEDHNKHKDLHALFDTKKQEPGPLLQKHIEQMMKKGATQEEIDAVKKRQKEIVIRLNPENATMNGLLCLKKAQDVNNTWREYELSQAFYYFSEALKTDNTFTKALIGISMCYEQFRDRKERIGEWLARAYSLDPKYFARIEHTLKMDILQKNLASMQS